MNAQGLRDQPTYSFAEADHLAGAKPGTARRWIKGYNYLRDGERHYLPAVTPRPEDVTAASFLDLLEIVAIGRLRVAGHSLPAVRSFVIELQELLDLPRPLVQVKLKTDGRESFLDHGDVLVGLGRRHRMRAWNEILNPFLEELDYSEGWAERWWPLGRDRLIVVDPEYGFGQPVIAGSGVRTEIVMERYRAKELAEDIAADFNLERAEVERAIQYEVTRQAA
jgi:uncharacterized protein (DUF433 family)